MIEPSKILLTNTKGGLQRIITIDIDSWNKIMPYIEKEGKFKFDESAYRKQLNKALEVTGEVARGTHSARWHFAQNEYKRLTQEESKDIYYSKKAILEAMGHHRPSITSRYVEGYSVYAKK